MIRFGDPKAHAASWVSVLERFERPDRVIGVYVLLNGKIPIYVGKTTNLGSRVRGHLKKEWTHGVIIKCERSELEDLELNLIRLLLPELNRAGMPDVTISEGVRRELDNNRLWLDARRSWMQLFNQSPEAKDQTT